jgi:nucleotide-binding universal stress UspA family protein
MEGRHAFPFRDFLVARTYELRADGAAMLVADALADAVGDVAVLRVEHDAVERAARHAALAVVGTPVRRRPPGMPGGDASLLAARLGVPVVVVPERCVSVDFRSVRSIVCGVRDPADTSCVRVAAALADALDLQLVLAHVCAPASLGAVGAVPMPAAPGPAGQHDRAAARELLGEVARRAGRAGSGASCPRLAEGSRSEELCRVGSDERAAFIAVTASRRGRFSSAFLGSVARDLTRQADRPVLVCPRRPSRRLALDSVTGAQPSRAG